MKTIERKRGDCWTEEYCTRNHLYLFGEQLGKIVLYGLLVVFCIAVWVQMIRLFIAFPVQILLIALFAILVVLFGLAIIAVEKSGIRLHLKKGKTDEPEPTKDDRDYSICGCPSCVEGRTTRGNYG